ncbi:hypothetical protein Tco_1525038 [Tanacetum coccineum]
MALTAYADADHAGCQDTRRSTSGSAQFLGDKLNCADNMANEHVPSPATTRSDDQILLFNAWVSIGKGQHVLDLPKKQDEPNQHTLSGTRIPTILPEPEGSTQDTPIDKVEVRRLKPDTYYGNLFNKNLLNMNLPDHKGPSPHGFRGLLSPTRLSERMTKQPYSFCNSDEYYHDPEKCDHASPKITTSHGGNTATGMIWRCTVAE